MNTNKIALKLSLPLAALIIAASICGLFTPGFYAAESLNWQAQSIGQDAIDLFLISPILIVLAVLSRENKIAFRLWGGVNFYLIYTFVIYCFDIHFNNLFIAYCFILGLSFYSFMYFVLSGINEPIANEIHSKSIVKAISAYFFIISVLFYFLWLSEIVPAIMYHEAPKTLSEAGLFTNPVHVIDLSIILPGFFITGVVLAKGKPIGLLLAPCLLMFCILMDITITSLTIIEKMRGFVSGYSTAIIMAVLALLSSVLLISFSKRGQ